MGGPLDTHTLWTSPKKGTLVTCVRTPPNTDLCVILGQTVTLVSGKNENTIQIQFIKEKIMCQREHATYITDREPNCLWRITDLLPDSNNHIMSTVTPIKRKQLENGQQNNTNQRGQKPYHTPHRTNGSHYTSTVSRLPNHQKIFRTSQQKYERKLYPRKLFI